MLLSNYICLSVSVPISIRMSFCPSFLRYRDLARGIRSVCRGLPHRVGPLHGSLHKTYMSVSLVSALDV